MRELLKKGQEVTIVPKDFNDTNKGVVTEVDIKGFTMKMKYPLRGINLRHVCEFYSHTENGTLFFESYTREMKDNTICVVNPIKHRFLQRRMYTRIKFVEQVLLSDKEGTYSITSLDISAGGMKFKSDKHINIDHEYTVEIPLNDEREVKCKIQPIRIEKQDDGNYILSGRFTNLSNIDKMTLIQFCMQKNMENVNK